MSETPRADFWFAILLTALGGAIAVEAWRMPRLENLGVHPMSAPGLTPGLLGLVLGVLGVMLLWRSRHAYAAVAPPEETTAAGGWLRFVTTLALCLMYATVLLGRLPFWLGTALFVFTFVVTFTWRRHPPMKVGLYAVGLALIVAVAVTLLFEKVFLVRLP